MEEQWPASLSLPELAVLPHEVALEQQSGRGEVRDLVLYTHTHTHTLSRCPFLWTVKANNCCLSWFLHSLLIILVVCPMRGFLHVCGTESQNARRALEAEVTDEVGVVSTTPQPLPASSTVGRKATQAVRQRAWSQSVCLWVACMLLI